MGDIAKYQNIFKDDPRVDVNWGKMMDTYETLSDIPGASEFITYTEGPSPQEIAKQQQEQQMQLEQAKLEQQAQFKEAEMAQAESQQAAQPQMITNGAGMFHNPDIANMADAIQKM